jgi:hypothetical protein
VVPLFASNPAGTKKLALKKIAGKIVNFHQKKTKINRFAGRVRAFARHSNPWRRVSRF